MDSRLVLDNQLYNFSVGVPLDVMHTSSEEEDLLGADKEFGGPLQPDKPLVCLSLLALESHGIYDSTYTAHQEFQLQ